MRTSIKRAIDREICDPKPGSHSVTVERVSIFGAVWCGVHVSLARALQSEEVCSASEEL